MKIGDAANDLEMKAHRASVERHDAQVSSVKASAEAQKPAPAPAQTIESVTRQIDSFLRSQNHQLQFRVDQGSGKMIVTVTDAETGEVIRQVPGEDALKMAQRIEDMTGLLDETA